MSEASEHNPTGQQKPLPRIETDDVDIPKLTDLPVALQVTREPSAENTEIREYVRPDGIRIVSTIRGGTDVGVQAINPEGKVLGTYYTEIAEFGGNREGVPVVNGYIDVVKHARGIKIGSDLARAGMAELDKVGPIIHQVAFSTKGLRSMGREFMEAGYEETLHGVWEKTYEQEPESHQPERKAMGVERGKEKPEWEFKRTGRQGENEAYRRLTPDVVGAADKEGSFKHIVDLLMQEKGMSRERAEDLAGHEVDHATNSFAGIDNHPVRGYFAAVHELTNEGIGDYSHLAWVPLEEMSSGQERKMVEAPGKGMAHDDRKRADVLSGRLRESIYDQEEGSSSTELADSVILNPELAQLLGRPDLLASAIEAKGMEGLAELATSEGINIGALLQRLEGQESEPGSVLERLRETWQPKTWPIEVETSPASEMSRGRVLRILTGEEPASAENIRQALDSVKDDPNFDALQRVGARTLRIADQNEMTEATELQSLMQLEARRMAMGEIERLNNRLAKEGTRFLKSEELAELSGRINDIIGNLQSGARDALEDVRVAVTDTVDLMSERLGELGADAINTIGDWLVERQVNWDAIVDAERDLLPEQKAILKEAMKQGLVTSKDVAIGSTKFVLTNALKVTILTGIGVYRVAETGVKVAQAVDMITGISDAMGSVVHAAPGVGRGVAHLTGRGVSTVGKRVIARTPLEKVGKVDVISYGESEIERRVEYKPNIVGQAAEHADVRRARQGKRAGREAERGPVPAESVLPGESGEGAEVKSVKGERKGGAPGYFERSAQKRADRVGRQTEEFFGKLGGLETYYDFLRAGKDLTSLAEQVRGMKRDGFDTAELEERLSTARGLVDQGNTQRIEEVKADKQAAIEKSRRDREARKAAKEVKEEEDRQGRATARAEGERRRKVHRERYGPKPRQQDQREETGTQVPQQAERRPSGKTGVSQAKDAQPQSQRGDQPSVGKGVGLGSLAKGLGSLIGGLRSVGKPEPVRKSRQAETAQHPRPIQIKRAPNKAPIGKEPDADYSWRDESRTPSRSVKQSTRTPGPSRQGAARSFADISDASLPPKTEATTRAIEVPTLHGHDADRTPVESVPPPPPPGDLTREELAAAYRGLNDRMEEISSDPDFEGEIPADLKPVADALTSAIDSKVSIAGDAKIAATIRGFLSE